MQAQEAFPGTRNKVRCQHTEVVNFTSRIVGVKLLGKAMLLANQRVSFVLADPARKWMIEFGTQDQWHRILLL